STSPPPTTTVWIWSSSAVRSASARGAKRSTPTVTRSTRSFNKHLQGVTTLRALARTGVAASTSTYNVPGPATSMYLLQQAGGCMNKQRQAGQGTVDGQGT